MSAKKRIIPFIRTKITAKEKEEGIVDEGVIGDLQYKVFSRGVIHIFDKEQKCIFKKDCELFEKSLDELNLNSLTEGKNRKIVGSGDNDTLIFTWINGDITVSLEKPEYDTIAKLKKILNLGKKNKEV